MADQKQVELLARELYIKAHSDLSVLEAMGKETDIRRCEIFRELAGICFDAANSYYDMVGIRLPEALDEK